MKSGQIVMESTQDSGILFSVGKGSFDVAVWAVIGKKNSNFHSFGF